MEAVCYAILFGDRVIREDNGKIGIIGSFGNLLAPSVPFQTQPWGIYIALDNVSVGEYSLTANLVHEKTQAVVLPINIKFSQQLKGPIEINIPVVGIWFPDYGDYSFTVNLEGQLVGSRVLRVMRPEAPK